MPRDLRDVTRDNPIYQKLFEKFESDIPHHWIYGSYTSTPGNSIHNDFIRTAGDEQSVIDITERTQEDHEHKVFSRIKFNESVVKNKEMTKTLPKFRRAHMNLNAHSIDTNPFTQTPNTNQYPPP